MKGSKPIAGRHLGWSQKDLATKPYAKFWNPDVAPVADHVRDALAQGPVSEELLPPLSAAQDVFFGSGVALVDGFSLVADGSLRVASDVDMPGVTPGGSVGIRTVRNATSFGIRRRMFMRRGRRRRLKARRAARAMWATRRSSTSIWAARWCAARSALCRRRRSASGMIA